MIRVRISAASRELLAAHARGTLLGAEEQTDGSFLIMLSGKVAAKLEEFDTDIDKAIEILCTRQFGRG